MLVRRPEPPKLILDRHVALISSTMESLHPHFCPLVIPPSFLIFNSGDSSPDESQRLWVQVEVARPMLDVWDNKLDVQTIKSLRNSNTPCVCVYRTRLLNYMDFWRTGGDLELPHFLKISFSVPSQSEHCGIGPRSILLSLI